MSAIHLSVQPIHMSQQEDQTHLLSTTDPVFFWFLIKFSHDAEAKLEFQK